MTKDLMQVGVERSKVQHQHLFRRVTLAPWRSLALALHILRQNQGFKALPVNQALITLKQKYR